MLVRNWFRAPRHLLVLFLVIVLLPSALLVVSGWRLITQEAHQEQQARREQMADRVVAVLQQRIAAVEAHLREGRPDAGPADDAIVIVFNGDRLVAAPERRLLYYPTGYPVTNAVSGGRRVPVETAIREASNFRRFGHVDAALAVLTRTAVAPDASLAEVAGVPADLFARWAECDLLDSVGRRDQLTARAEVLHSDLVGRRWRLSRVAFETHFEDANRWRGVGTSGESLTTELALSAAVDDVWQRWRNSPSSALSTSRRERLTVEGRDLVAVWFGDEKRMAAFIAGPRHVDMHWLADVRAAAERQQLTVALLGPGAPRPSATEARRTGDDLPWTVAVSGGATPDSLANSGSFRLWLGGTLLLALIVIGGTTVIARAMSQELAVARLQSDFVAAVSHEFRTPLTSLRQIGEVLHDGRVSDERRVSYYDALVRQTTRLHRLVETLLDFGRMEAGRSPYRRVPVDLSSWSRTVVEEFNREVTPRGYSVELTVTDEPLPVLADTHALTNALWNLLDNAVKYSPDCRTVWVALNRSGPMAQVQVRDRGIGVPAAERRDIFRKFIRGGEAKRHNIGGTGIGLSMVEHIMTAHDGRVRVESGPGSGSTFTLEIPCHVS